MTQILGIQRRMVELGRIRTGDRGGTNRAPRKLSNFRLTSASRPLLEAAARIYGGTVRAWQDGPDDGLWELLTETDVLDIMVPPVITAYSQSYEVWDAGGCTVRCDGRWESIAGAPCSHGIEHEGMKVTTRVSVILPKLPGLGTWRLETHGWNAAATLPASLDLLIQAGQRNQWLPATLRLEPRTQKTRVNGKPQTRKFSVPVIDIAGFTFEEMVALGSGSTEYEALPEGLPVQPGPSRPRGMVGRPELPPAPELPAEAQAFSRPVERAFPVEQPAVQEASAAGPVADQETVAVDTQQRRDGEPIQGAPGPSDSGSAPTATVSPIGRLALFREIKTLGLPEQAVVDRAATLYPDVPPKDLSDDQRGEVLASLRADPPTVAMGLS